MRSAPLFEPGPVNGVLGPRLAGKRPKHQNQNLYFSVLILEVLTTVFIVVLAPPRGVPGEGPDCHCPKGIVGFGADSGPNPGFLSFILALKGPIGPKKA